jgi:hypothetical protein
MDLNDYVNQCEKVISQMPGFVIIHNLAQEIVLVNDRAAEVMA